MGQGILEWTKYKQTYHFKFFKVHLPQNLLGPFLNTLTHIMVINDESLTVIKTVIIQRLITMVISLSLYFYVFECTCICKLVCNMHLP